MIDLIHARDFDIHVLVAKQDIDLPIVWTLAVNRAGTLPAAFCSGGSGANPASALRGALREVAQLVTDPVDPDPSDIEPFLADPWNLEELVHHPRLYMHPDTLPRTTTVLGGPKVSLADAFPDWPDRLRRASGGDVRGALDYVRGLFADAGLDTIILVDQTTREHADAGISIAKAVVPGILPVTFGHAQQRLQGLTRLERALAGTPQADREIPYDPHPFP
jgi:ribosomal protein S12 methylthiotransferase accessory factor